MYGECFYNLGCTERIPIIIFVGIHILPSAKPVLVVQRYGTTSEQVKYGV
jgi:hypothetical protein